MDAVSVGSVEGLSRGELQEQMNIIERDLRKRLPVGWTTSYASLLKEFVNVQGHTAHALDRTLFVMEKSEIIKFQGQRKVICRYVELAPHLCLF
jgi:DNA replication licensing factor MCM5